MERILIVKRDNSLLDEFVREKELADAIKLQVGEGEYVPNFTIPGRDDFSAEAKKRMPFPYSDVPPALSFLDSMSVASLIVTPFFPGLLISKFLANEDEEEEEKIREQIRQETLKISLSKSQAERLGYRFPPGHPRFDHFYRQHPLAERKESVKRGFYLPELAYETVLLEERESELLELLMDLGACEIQITKQVESLLEDANELKGGLGVDGVAGVTASSKLCTEQNEKEASKRIFKLRGRPWEAGFQFDTEPYCWYEFEPSWKTIVKARLLGCTNAAIEVSQSSLFSEDRELYLQAKLKFFEANGGVGIMKKDFQKVSFVVEVKFPE